MWPLEQLEPLLERGLTIWNAGLAMVGRV
jgi:hypothetical protein